MWFTDEVLSPRYFKSLIWMCVAHHSYMVILIIFLRMLSWEPMSVFADSFSFFHWEILMHLCILHLCTAAFSALHVRYYAVEKQVCSSRFERLCKSMNPYYFQHVCASSALGGISVYCYIVIFSSFDPEAISITGLCFSLQNGFDYAVAIGHGCYVGMLFSLKYFLCDMYLLKFSLLEMPKLQYVQSHFIPKLKESFIDILKSIHWYYIILILFSPFTRNMMSISFSNHLMMLYDLINLKLFLTIILTGVLVHFTWSLYLCLFNAFCVEHHSFSIQAPLKEAKYKLLCHALISNVSLQKYLAVLDLRLLSQHNSERRKEFFQISQPGGHPYMWKSLSNIFLASMNEFVLKLVEISTAITKATVNAAQAINDSKFEMNAKCQMTNSLSLVENVALYFREKPLVAYFLHELPNAKTINLFASSEPLVWMIEAIGYLVSASYTEDKYGVVQQTISSIIIVILDAKMAEEKLGLCVTGIRSYVREPQGRFDYIHQRLRFKSAIHHTLARIAFTFKKDINGIYLPDLYRRHLLTFVDKNSKASKQIL